MENLTRVKNAPKAAASGCFFPIFSCLDHRFGDALRVVQDNLDAKNYYAFNPAFDVRPPERPWPSPQSRTSESDLTPPEMQPPKDCKNCK